jgi:hypothetical protein
MARILLFNLTKATTAGSYRLGRNSRIHYAVMAVAFLFLSSMGNAFSSPEHHGLAAGRRSTRGNIMTHRRRQQRSETTSLGLGCSFPHFLLSSLRGGDRIHHGTTTATSTTSLNMVPPPVLFDATQLASANIVIVAANLVGLIISLVTGSHLHLDLLGTGAFSLAALVPLVVQSSSLLRVQVSCGAVLLWSVKLASFLFYRALQIKTDARLDDLLSTPSGTGKSTHT